MELPAARRVEEFNELIGVCIVSTREFVDNNPKSSKLSAALAEAQEFVASDPEAAGKALTRTLLRTSTPTSSPPPGSRRRPATPKSVLFTRENWETYLELFGDASDKDLESIVYETSSPNPPVVSPKAGHDHLH